jgi:hypothetical protein
MPRSLSQIANLALSVQDACNPLAVARLYVAITDELRERHNVLGTDAIRRHPCVVLIAHKLADLSNVASFADTSYFDAFSECTAMAAIADELDAAQRRLAEPNEDHATADRLIPADGFADGGCAYTQEELDAAALATFGSFARTNAALGLLEGVR